MRYPRGGPWVALGLWLLAGCGRPAADSGEVSKPSEVGQAQPPAAELPSATPVPAAEPAPAAVPAPTPEPAAQPIAAPADPQPSAAPSQPSDRDPMLAAQQVVPVSGSQDVPVPGELRLAMEELSEAVREHDAARVLEKFSRSAGFRYSDSRKQKPIIQAISFDRLQRELGAKSGLYRTLLEPSGLVQYVSGEHAVPWRGVSQDEFAPRGVDANKVWVRWRSEGDTWVVDTIALPAPLPRSH